MRECEECGKEFRESGEATVCGVCDLELRAREPSQQLKDMRAVYEGVGAATGGQRVLRSMLDKNPDRFMARLEEAERAWAEQVARVTQPVKVIDEQAQADEQSEGVERLIEELLAEGDS